MGILLSAMAAAGDAGVQSMNQNIEQQNKLDAMDRQSELETQKAKVIAEHNMDYAEKIKNAPLQRLGVIAQRMAGEEVPVTAAPVTKLSGYDPNSSYDGEASDGKGLVGMTRDQVAAYQDPDMLAQYDRQMASDNKAAQDAVVGQTRKRTPEEVLSATMAQVKADGDFGALMAGKALATDKYVNVADGGTLYDTTTGKAVFSNNNKAERQEKSDDRKDDRQTEREDGKDRRQQESLAAMFERFSSKSGGEGTSLTQNVALLKSLGYSDAKIQDFIFNKKETSLDDVVTKFVAADPYFGTAKAMPMPKIVEMAKDMRRRIGEQAGAESPSPSAPTKPFNPSDFMTK